MLLMIVQKEGAAESEEHFQNVFQVVKTELEETNPQELKTK